MMKLNINANAVVAHTLRLEKIGKYALPAAIRGTLNGAVFDVKTNTMLRTSAQAFVKRTTGDFFRANSRFENAKGNDVKNMQAIVGMTSENLQGDHNYAVKDLEQQERGGTILGRSFIPLKSARIGNNPNKPVRPNARLSKIKKVINARNVKGKTPAEKFMKAIIQAGPDGFVIGGKKKILYQVKYKGRTNIKTKKSKIKFKLIPLYQYRKGRKVRVKPTNFMQKASLQSAEKMEHNFMIEAERQIKRVKK